MSSKSDKWEKASTFISGFSSLLAVIALIVSCRTLVVSQDMLTEAAAQLGVAEEQLEVASFQLDEAQSQTRVALADEIPHFRFAGTYSNDDGGLVYRFENIGGYASEEAGGMQMDDCVFVIPSAEKEDARQTFWYITNRYKGPRWEFWTKSILGG